MSSSSVTLRQVRELKYYGEYDPNHVLCTIDVMMPDGRIVGFAATRLEVMA